MYVTMQYASYVNYAVLPIYYVVLPTQEMFLLCLSLRQI